MSKALLLVASSGTTHVMVVKMAVGLPFMLVRTHVLQELVANTAHEALGVPALVHGAHNAANDGICASCAEDG